MKVPLGKLGTEFNYPAVPCKVRQFPTIEIRCDFRVLHRISWDSLMAQAKTFLFNFLYFFTTFFYINILNI